MKLHSVTFVNPVRDLIGNQNQNTFMACDSLSRAPGYGYSLEAIDGGVIATHPKSSTKRLIPWSNVRWVDVAEGVSASLPEPEPVPVPFTPEVAASLPKREHWKTKAKREREAAANNPPPEVA